MGTYDQEKQRAFGLELLREKDMADRKVRVILVVPANNTTMEREIPVYCPEITDLQVARVPRPHRPLAVPDLPEYRRRTVATVAPLVQGGADLVIYGCTAAGFLAGPQGDTEAVRALSDLTGAPVVSTAVAMGAALHHSGLRRVDLVSPYLDWKNEILISFLAAAGVTVAGSGSFSAKNPTELATITAEQVMQKAQEVARPDSEGLFIACVQLPTIDVIPVLATRLQRPVWSAVRAAAWAALTTLALPAERLVPQRSQYPAGAVKETVAG
jgi:maleate cis-trans isomerase